MRRLPRAALLLGAVVMVLSSTASSWSSSTGLTPLLITTDRSRFSSRVGPDSIPIPPVVPLQVATGACCLGNGGCVPASSDAQCAAMGGVFLPGQDCASNPCGPGACCSETSCGLADAFTCITAGRIFAGAGTLCADNPCQITVGACCTGGQCLAISPQACAQAGGTWLGPGTVCGPVTCVPGACCLGESCTAMRGHECMPTGGTFVPGASCAAKPCARPDACPGDTLFSQSLDGPDDFIAGTSEQAANLRRWENFSGVGGAIEAVTWWGLDLRPLGGSMWAECAEADPTFIIAFHADAGGVPGAVVCSYTIAAQRIPLGVLYLGTELNEYRATLPAPCVLVNGWISIVGLGDPNCWFLWMSAGSGSSICDHCLPPQQDFDLAVCLRGTKGGVAGACCTDATSQCLDGVDISQCTAPGQRFVPGKSCDEIDPPCGVILGACCVPDATCALTQEKDCASPATWLGPWTICSSCPCITPCPPGGSAEGEPDCAAGYIDEFNGGCLAELIAFSPIALNQTICGRSGTFPLGADTVPDFDWYELTLPTRTQVTWRGSAEFRLRLVIVDGSGGCADLKVLAASDVYECEEAEVTGTLGPGTHWLVAVPWAFTDSAACGARYLARAEGRALSPADLNGDGHVTGIDLALLLGQWTGASLYAPCPPHRPADLNQDCRVNGLDIAILLGDWG